MRLADSGPQRLGRVLGIDYGTVRLGLALSDAGRQIASPYENYTRVTPQQDARHLRQVILQEQVVQLVVGLPVHLDGRESRKSTEARQFGSWLVAETGLPVTYVDERFTSHEAEQHLLSANLSRAKRKQRRDMLAAQLLLQSYLDAPDAAGGQLKGLDSP